MRNRYLSAHAAFLLLLVLLARPGQAQVDQYTFAPRAGTFVPLVGGTNVPVIQGDDFVSASLPLGFSFVFDGIPYAQVVASSNGYLSFNTAAVGTIHPMLGGTANGTEKPLVAPLNDDLGGNGGTATYLTTGAAPNRVFTMEWKNWQWRYDAGGPVVSFQVKLYETTNVVECIYQPGTTVSTGSSGSIGLAGALGSGTAGASAFLSLNGTGPAPTASAVVETTTLSAVPAAGQVYAFTPPVPAACPTPRNPTAVLNATGATLSWTAVGSGPFKVQYGPTGFNPAAASSATNVYTTLTGITGTSTPITGLTPTTGYQFYVTQTCGGTAGNSLPSAAGAFTTLPVAAPNDDCAAAVLLPVAATCAAPVTGTVFGATQSLPAGCSSLATAMDVWYKFVATGTAHTITLAPLFTAYLEVRSGTCASSASLYCGYVNNSATSPTPSLLLGGLTAGQTYYLRVYPYSVPGPAAALSTFTLCVTPGPTSPPANDECAAATALPITAACTTPVAGTVANATQSLPGVVCGSSAIVTAQARDVWYRFVAGGATQVLTATVPFQTVVELRPGTCGTGAALSCTTIYGTAANPTATSYSLTGLTAGQPYTLRIYPSPSSGIPAVPTFSLCLNPGPTVPTNDDCATPTVLPVTTACTTPTAGTVAGASASAGTFTSTCTSVVATADVWYRFTATATAQLLTFAPQFGGYADVRSGTCASSTSVACTSASSSSPRTILVPGLTVGQGYLVRVFSSASPAPVGGSAAFTLCLTNVPPPPANDDCAGALPLPITTDCTAPTAGTLASATLSAGTLATTCAAITVGVDAWYRFTATAVAGLLTFTGPFNGLVEVRSGTCASNTGLACLRIGGGSGPQVLFVPGLVPGQPYFVRVASQSSTTPLLGVGAAFTLCLVNAPPPPANDDCAGALPLPVTTACATPITGTVASATLGAAVVGSPCSTLSYASDVWYRFTATGTAHLLTFGAQFYGAVDVRSGTCATNTSLLTACRTASGGGATTFPIAGLVVGQQYLVRVAVPDNGTVLTGSSATFTLCLTAAPPTPAYDNCAGALALPVQVGGCTAPTLADLTSALPSPASIPRPTCNTTANNDVWYQLVVPPSGIVTVQAMRPTGGTVISYPGLAVYGGPCGGTLAELGCATGYPSSLNGVITLIGRSAGSTLYVRAWSTANEFGQVGVCASTPAVCLSPAALLTDSLGSTRAVLGWVPGNPLAAGASYTLEYGTPGFVPGAGTGTRITGLTTPRYVLTNLRASTEYCFYVRQDCGPVYGSSAFTGPECFLTPLPPPANDEPCNAVALPLSFAAGAPVAGTTVGATATHAPGIVLPPSCSLATDPHDVWYSFTLPAGATDLLLTLTGTTAGVVRGYTAPACATGPFTPVFCLGSGNRNRPLGTVQVSGLTAGQRYLLAVHSFGSSDTPGPFTLAATARLPSATRGAAGAAGLLISPNPSATGRLALHRVGALAGAGRAELLNALGQVVRQQEVPAAAETAFDASGLAAGIYTLRVTAGEASAVQRVVLE